MPTRPVIVAAVRQEAAAAQTCHTVVRRALFGGRPIGGAASLPLAGGYEGASAWLAGRAAAGKGCGVVVVQPEIRPDEAVALLRAGADGVVADQSPGWLIRHAVTVVADGGMFLDPWLAHDVADFARPRTGNLGHMGGMEQRVLRRAARGMAPDAIAAELRMPPEEVTTILQSVHERLGTTRTRLAPVAQAMGLLPAGHNRAAATAWETVRGLHGIGVFVTGRDPRARALVAKALTHTGARVLGDGPDAAALRSVADQWQVTVALVGDGELDLREVRTARPRAALVALARRVGTSSVARALAAGAQGILPVSAHPARLVAAARSAAAAGLYLAPEAVRLVLEAAGPTAGLTAGALTPRQLQVLRLADEGRTNREIAEALGLAEPTVKGHLRHVLRALRSTSRREAASTARRLGLLAGR